MWMEINFRKCLIHRFHYLLPKEGLPVTPPLVAEKIPVVKREKRKDISLGNQAGATGNLNSIDRPVHLRLGLITRAMRISIITGDFGHQRRLGKRG
jgi:hypothetical protein